MRFETSCRTERDRAEFARSASKSARSKEPYITPADDIVLSQPMRTDHNPLTNVKCGSRDSGTGAEAEEAAIVYAVDITEQKAASNPRWPRARRSRRIRPSMAGGIAA